MTDASPKLSNKQPCDREDALAVLKRLREAGHVAYFAGGCVRDELMGLVPSDYDVATDAPPQSVRELFSNTQSVGAAFGVILVRHRRSIVEVATFRAERGYEDGRRPTEVRFTTAEEDAQRRDFTINGLFLDPLENRVIDYVGGQQDIRARLLRAIGNPDHRFEEDHLRLLRAVRFAARFELEIEPATSAAVRAHASQLQRISPERIAEELRMTLTLPQQRGDWAWHALLIDYPGLSDVIFRFLGPPPDLEARRQHARIFEGFPAAEPWIFGLCLAAISLDWVMMQSGSGQVAPLLQHESVRRISRALRKSLRISNEEDDQLTGSLEGVAILLRDPPARLAVYKRFLARPTSRLSRQLLDALAGHVGHSRVQEMNQRLDEIAQTEFAPPPLVTGDDLVARGMVPGPAFKAALDQAYDEQLEGTLTSRELATELAEKLVREFKPAARKRPSSGLRSSRPRSA